MRTLYLRSIRYYNGILKGWLSRIRRGETGEAYTTYNDPRVLLGCDRGSAVVIVLLDVIGEVGYKQWVKLY